MKKHNNFQSPDLSKLQGVTIDHKTTIFIAIGADPIKAQKKYQDQLYAKYIKPR